MKCDQAAGSQEISAFAQLLRDRRADNLVIVALVQARSGRRPDDADALQVIGNAPPAMAYLAGSSAQFGSSSLDLSPRSSTMR